MAKNSMSNSTQPHFVRSAVPISDEEVREAIRHLSFGGALSLAQRETVLSEYVARYRTWIESSTINQVRGLNTYEFSYFAHGTTQAMDHFIFRHASRRIRVLKGEYPYLRDVLKRMGRSWSWIGESNLAVGDALMISHPFSGSGAEHPDFRELLDRCATLGIPVFVDCAFFGVCGGIEFPLAHPAIETVGFSLSKEFAVGTWRIGLALSRIDDPMLSTQAEWDYVNHLGIYVGSRLLERFGPDFTFAKYRALQIEVCSKSGLTPSSTVLFGIGGEEYSEFQRDHVINRVCLSPEIEILSQTRSKLA